MNEIARKLVKGLALLVVGGVVLGGTIAFAGGTSTPSAVRSSSTSQTPAVSGAPAADDDGTPDQGPGDVAVVGGNASTDDDGTPDQGPGDANQNDDHGDDDDHEAEGDDDNSGPSGNSGPGSVDDDSGHGEDD